MLIAFYKGTRPGINGVYNRGVRWWTHGDYSHCELIFADSISASASFMDGGVRFKQIDFDPLHWDFIEVDADEGFARAWFTKHEHDKYDLMGNVRFVVPALDNDKDKWFCSEAIAAALGINEPWRFDPNTLYAFLSSLPLRKINLA